MKIIYQYESRRRIEVPHRHCPGCGYPIDSQPRWQKQCRACLSYTRAWRHNRAVAALLRDAQR
jgi:predicted nucleic acid-binding Zn ribbon protein